MAHKKVVQNLTHLQQVSGKALECLLELGNGSRVVEAAKKA